MFNRVHIRWLAWLLKVFNAFSWVILAIWQGDIFLSKFMFSSRSTNSDQPLLQIERQTITEKLLCFIVGCNLFTSNSPSQSLQTLIRPLLGNTANLESSENATTCQNVSSFSTISLAQTFLHLMLDGCTSGVPLDALRSNQIWPLYFDWCELVLSEDHMDFNTHLILISSIRKRERQTTPVEFELWTY